GPALWPALLNLHGRVLTTTPGGGCHASTSRPRPFRGVPQRRDVVAVSLFLAPPLSRRCSHNSTASHPDAGFVHSRPQRATVATLVRFESDRQDGGVVLRRARPFRHVLLGRQDNLVDRDAVLPGLDDQSLVPAARESETHA